MVAAHQGLDRFRQDLPGLLQVLVQALRVDLELRQPLQGCLPGDQAVRQPHAQVAHHGGVGEVTLPAGDGQLAGEVVEDRVGQAQVALGVLEVDGIDLVRHGGGAHLAGHGALLEVAQGDVAPEVPVQVDQDGVEAAQDVEQLRHAVVGFDLGGVGVPAQPQGLDEAAAERFPVHLRVGTEVGVVVAHGAVHLAHEHGVAQLLALAGQAVGAVGQLLADGGG